MTAELIVRFLIPGNERRVRALRETKHLIVDRVMVKVAHRAQIRLVLFQIAGLEQRLDTSLDLIGQLFYLFLDGLFFCHKLLLCRQKAASAQTVRSCGGCFVI